LLDHEGLALGGWLSGGGVAREAVYLRGHCVVEIGYGGHGGGCVWWCATTSPESALGGGLVVVVVVSVWGREGARSLGGTVVPGSRWRRPEVPALNRGGRFAAMHARLKRDDADADVQKRMFW
jgi:hypothetical protein